jgi:methylated-DNA-[protein]-cysteine S-methyltransferase
MAIEYCVLEAEPGQVYVAESPQGVFAVAMGDQGFEEITAQVRRHYPDQQLVPSIISSARQVEEYLTGRRRSFDLPLDLKGTDFQIEVWNALTAIEYGRTQTYGGIAEDIGRPGSARAVGAACGANPVPLIVPCHRVLGGDGELTGFGPGLHWKEWLLALESL